MLKAGTQIPIPPHPLISITLSPLTLTLTSIMSQSSVMSSCSFLAWLLLSATKLWIETWRLVSNLLTPST